jgi:chromosome segregation ATPase
MPRKASTPTIKELRRQLAAKEKQLDKAVAERSRLATRLAELDAEIAALGGAPAPKRKKRRKAAKKAGRKPGRKPGRPAKKKAAKRKVAKKARRGKPLAAYIVGVLKGAAGGMRVKNVMAAVVKAGYATQSKDFYGIVAATLRDETKFKKISRGVYTLA